MIAGEAARLVDLERGTVSRKIFADPDIYREEIERVFARCWLYLAHESQIPNAGDYVNVFMGEEPVLVCRDADESIHAFINSCRRLGPRRKSAACRCRPRCNEREANRPGRSCSSRLR